jgi:AraC-like DNA-binding protein
MHRTAADELMLDHVDCSMDTSLTCEPLRLLYFFFLTHGRFDIRWRGRESLKQPGDAFLWPMGVPLDIDWTGYHTELLSVPVHVAERAAAERDGRGGVRFLGTSPVDAAADRLWRATSGFVASQLENPAEPLSQPLAYSRALELIGTAAIQTFPNTTMTREYLPGPGQVAPVGLRQAMDYIEAYAASPITLSDIASVVSATPEALMHAFDLHYGFGPLEYLRRIRLERAHVELQVAAPESGVTVASIAARWGFLDPRRFVNAYRERYGRSPGQTLRV